MDRLETVANNQELSQLLIGIYTFKIASFQHYMSNNLHHLLPEIRNALNEHLQPKTTKFLTPERITKLLFHIEDMSHSTENILTSILGSPQHLALLRKVLANRLRAQNGETSFQEIYGSHMMNSPESYRCSLDDINRTIKDVLCSTRPIEEELLKLRANFNSHLGIKIDDQVDSWPQEKLEVGCLLKMAMESHKLDLQQQFDQLLFRIFILWESLTIVLHKTQFVLDHLNSTIRPEPALKSIKELSSVGKRSTLSQSVEIYKQKKQEEKEKGKKVNVKASLSEPYRSKNLIPSDYKLVCKTRPEERKVDQGLICCFK